MVRGPIAVELRNVTGRRAMTMHSINQATGRCLAAAAAALLVSCAALACDDVDEELAMAAAKDTARLAVSAQAVTSEQAATTVTAAMTVAGAAASQVSEAPQR
jgi:hypothetical protein